MMTRIAAALLFGASALSPGLSLAADESSALDTAIQTAKTPAQHGALALTYHAKAEEARAMAKRHESMGRHVRGEEFRCSRPLQEHRREIHGDRRG